MINITQDLTLDYALHGEHSTYLKTLCRFRHTPRAKAIMDAADPIREMADLKCGPEGQFTTLSGAHLLTDPVVLQRAPEGEPDQLVPWTASSDDPTKIVWSSLECMQPNGYVGWLTYLCDKVLLPWGYTLDGVAQVVMSSGVTIDITVKKGAVTFVESKSEALPVKPKGKSTNFGAPFTFTAGPGPAPVASPMTWSVQLDQSPGWGPPATAAPSRTTRSVGGNYYGFSNAQNAEWVVIQAPTAADAERRVERDLGLSFAPEAWRRNPVDFGNRIVGVRERRLVATIYRADGRTERTH